MFLLEYFTDIALTYLFIVHVPVLLIVNHLGISSHILS